jgi:two-component system NtrC family response regulator
VAKIKRILADTKHSADDFKAKTLDEIERDAILDSIKQCNGNLSQVATSLGISRQALYRRMEKFGIQQ